MAITFVGSGVGTHAAITAQTYNFSSLLNDAGGTPTLQQGDIVYVAVENASTVNRGAGTLVPSGYTAAHTADYRGDSNDSNFQVSYKVMGVTPDTSVAIPASNATTAGVAYVVYVFRGVNTVAGPHSATPVVTGAINTGVANAPSITPTAGDTGAWIIAFGGAAVAAGAVFTNPAGMSTTTNHFRSTTITTTTNDANVAGAIYTGWTSGAYDPAVFGGSTSTNTGSWSAVTIALKPVIERTSSGALTGPGSTIAGSANHITIHGTTGALTGPGSSIVGSASRASAFVTHETSGALTGQGSTVAGTAVHNVPHATTGALTGQGSALAGSATRFRAFATSGALTGQGSAISGTAGRITVHATSGALVGQGSVIAGAAQNPNATPEVVERRHAGTRKGYIVQGQKYFLTEQELRALIAQLSQQVKRKDVQEVEAGKPKTMSRRTWLRLKQSLAALEALSEPEAPPRIVEQPYDEDDDEEALLMLL